VTVSALSEDYFETILKSQADSNGFELLTQTVSELHALISSSKAMFTWITRDALQEARECCGGHGYLKAANIGELRNNHDATVTYEGDNNVLGQQGSNWLLKQWNGNLESPLGSINFLSRRDVILARHSFKSLQSKNLSNVDFVLNCYEWLMCHLLNVSDTQIKRLKATGADSFKAKNDSQVYKARTLSSALAEYYAMCSFKKKFESTETTNDMKPVLSKIFKIYGFWNLDKHIATFYIGGFANGPEFSEFVRSNLIDACEDIKDCSVAIADALSPPDFVLKSVIGQSDGKVN
jgi:acyl-CoA oxidase